MQEEGESYSQEWPVKLFRLSQDETWEQAHTKDELRVSPRQNAIAFPSIRYRIKFQNSSSQEQQEDRVTVTIMRRYERISVTTMQPGQPPRCAVLQFDSEADSIEFCDDLLRLNSNMRIDNTNESLLEEPEEIIADIRRILMSEDFMEFVDNLEESLSSCPEGLALLDSLVGDNGDGG